MLFNSISLLTYLHLYNFTVFVSFLFSLHRHRSHHCIQDIIFISPVVSAFIADCFYVFNHIDSEFHWSSGFWTVFPLVSEAADIMLFYATSYIAVGLLLSMSRLFSSVYNIFLYDSIVVWLLSFSKSICILFPVVLFFMLIFN